MLDPAIEAFLSERKASRIKEKSKSCKTDEERQQVENDAAEEFSLENWLPKAAKRAGRLSISTHPCTFTHPSSRNHPDPKKKTTGVIANSTLNADGFLRTGNSEADLDVFGDAAALDVYKFLSIQLVDKETVLKHLEENTQTIQSQFTLLSESYEKIKTNLLSMKQTDGKNYITSERVKQVYFPVGSDYHLLSILTPSGLMFKFKKKIESIRFPSDEAKQARKDRDNKVHSTHGFSEIYNLTEIGFGGANKQNISILNSKNFGTASLLPSLPPQLETRTIRHPKTHFFSESLYHRDYQESFKDFQKVLKSHKDAFDEKGERDEIIVFIVKQVMEKVEQLRELEPNWSEKTNLSSAQKIWLDEAYQELRTTEKEWITEIAEDFSRWFRIAYEKIVGKENAIFMAQEELVHIRELIIEMAEELL